jgi:hypothetical protein
MTGDKKSRHTKTAQWLNSPFSMVADSLRLASGKASTMGTHNINTEAEIPL